MTALGYRSSIWSLLASLTSINKLQVMQNAALRTATGCTQNIQHLHDKTLILPTHEHLHLHASRYKQKTPHPLHPLHKIHHSSTLQSYKKLSLTTAVTQQTSHRPPHSHCNRHKNKHAPYTYAYCLYAFSHKRQ